MTESNTQPAVYEDTTPSQRLWIEVFGKDTGIPDLDEEKVSGIVDNLTDSNERLVIRLRFGFDGDPLPMGRIAKKLPRADGGRGVSRQRAQVIYKQALRHLKHPSRRRGWRETAID